MSRALSLTVALVGLVYMSSVSAGPRLYIFDCGTIEFADVSAFGLNNDETPVRELFVPCYVIEHEKGTLLWDAGLPLGIAGKAKHESRPSVSLEYKRAITDQLKDIAMRVSDVEYVAYSHFHYDHVGAANAFVDSTLLIQQTEYDAAFKQKVVVPAYVPALYSKLKQSPKVLLNGDYDIFGDGTVRIIYAPGHTPGHQVLLLDLENTGKVMLSGDLYHFRESREKRRIPVFNVNKEDTLSSIDKVEALLKAEGATLWIEHELALAKTLNLAPLSYD